MARPAAESAGLLLYRRAPAGLELFLAHPGGPFWQRRDAGAWTIPQGAVEPGESLLAAACRELEEETGIRPAGEGDADPALITSITMETEWPRGSGRRISFPEVDRCGWFGSAAARVRLNPAQAELVDRLESALGA